MRTSRKITTGLAAVAVAAGGALGAGSALGSGSSSGDDEDSPAITSSVTAPVETEESKDETEANDGAEGEAAEQAAEDAEQRTLLSLAGVDAAAARTAALATARGSVTETELENEDGNVVWKVEIRDRAGLETTVYVDAGNAKVLLKETEHEDGSEGVDD